MSSLAAFAGFRSLGWLGRGGTAEVLHVYSQRHRRELALKHPLSNDIESANVFASLARREQKLIGDLTFPGLVRIIEVSTDDPMYILLQLGRGPTLDQCGRIDDLPRAMNLLSAMALNLEYLRGNAIIHGDLKPHNVFLPSDWQLHEGDQLFYVKLSDFSLGRLEHEPDAQRAGLGTVGYMAPETVTDSRVSYRSDLFALGVIAYQMLSGTHPFMDADNDPVKAIARVREEAPPPLQVKRDGLPQGLVDLVNRLLAKDEAVRPRSGWEVCETLARIGARYPFEKALRPSHFSRTSSKSVARVWSVLNVTPEQRERLERLRQSDDACLRLVLTANFVKGNLRYDGDQFVFSRGIYWPACLRRRTLDTFHQATFGVKRQIVLVAIAGGISQARHLGVIRYGQSSNVPDTVVDAIRPLILSRTLRRCAGRYAVIAEKRGVLDLAARSYTQAGDLPGAERCAHQSAIALHGEQKNEAAIRLINHVIDYAQTVNRIFDVRRLLMVRGDIFKHEGRSADALSTYEQLIGIYDGHPVDKILAETYKDLGDTHRIRQEHEPSLRALRQALAIYEELGDELEISHVLNNIGNAHWVSSDLDAALAVYRQALRIQRRLQAATDTASTLSNIGAIYAIKGRLNRSLRTMNLSLELKKTIGDAGEIARSLNNLGYVYHLSGVPSQAITCLTESLEINRRIGSKKETLFNFENLTAFMITAGRLRESLPYLKEGLLLAETLADKQHLGVFNLSMGTVLRRMGKIGEAERYIGASEHIIEEIDDKMLPVQIAIQRGRMRYLVGDNAGAIACGQTALTGAKEANDTSGQLNALLLLTRVSSDPELVAHCERLIDELHLKRERLLLTCNQVEFLLSQGQSDQAAAVGNALPVDIERVDEDIELPWMCNVAAELMIDRGQTTIAPKCLARALRAATNSGLLPETVTILTLQGKLDLTAGDYEQSYAHFRAAMRTSKLIAQSLTNEVDRAFYSGKRETVLLVNEVQRMQTITGQQKRGRAITGPTLPPSQDCLTGQC
ncbi:MAG TPA: serine/threonine-protein kinase [Candidatus Deferrimicrobium sp.]|nr:serine/threonine-protein kinase [Candidatus Deferrimicrobium sp.]